jgi:hypothetical protein
VRGTASLFRLALVATLAAWLAPACSLGAGTGTCTGTLDVPDCWAGPFDLHPDFFAAVPSSGGALQIRIQNGGDYETFSDGMVILIDDGGQVRGDPANDGSPRPSLLGQSLVVALPPSVVPPGVPVKPVPDPRIVHASLYLERTCRTQNDALYAMDAVSVNADGSCDRPPGGDPPLACPGPATSGDGGAEAGPGDGGAAPGAVATSTITFNSLFDGNPAESDAKQRLTDATFDFYLADPREICPGGLGPPPRCRGHLTGSFHFYFERGKPAQPFP